MLMNSVIISSLSSSSWSLPTIIIIIIIELLFSSLLVLFWSPLVPCLWVVADELPTRYKFKYLQSRWRCRPVPAKKSAWQISFVSNISIQHAIHLFFFFSFLLSFKIFAVDIRFASDEKRKKKCEKNHLHLGTCFKNNVIIHSMAIHLTIYMTSGEIGGSFSIWKEDKLIYIQTRNQFQGNEKNEKKRKNCACV